MKDSKTTTAGARTHCSILRYKKETGSRECGAQLSSSREKRTGVCRSCAAGYSVKGDKFNDDKECARAKASNDQ